MGPKHKPDFYLRALEKANPAQWYSTCVLGIISIRKQSGTSRLFQVGLYHKIVKEFMGHASDAVHQYQITSDDQRKSVSEIIAGKGVEVNVVKVPSCSDLGEKGTI